MIRDRLIRKGFRVAAFNGEEKSGLEPFKKREVDVLIGSSALGTGVDGLQYVCNRLIVAGLPWTSAGYEQLLGRVYRQGSAFHDVEVFIPQVVLRNGTDEWSWDRQRLARIHYKKTLADAAVDGVVPEAKLASPELMLEEVRKADVAVFSLSLMGFTMRTTSTRPVASCGTAVGLKSLSLPRVGERAI
jgi:Helicase conserved C-terminal domain